MPVSQKKYPKTLEEAVERVLSLMAEEDKKKLKNTTEGDLGNLHFRLAMMIRGACGLWKGNGVLIRSCCPNTFPTHPDDASGVVLEAVWKTLQSMAL